MKDGYAIACTCGHERRNHQGLDGRCLMWIDGLDDPFVPGAKWKGCKCRTFDDSRLPEPGQRLEFGVHRQPTKAAETAEAWPPLPAWSARVRQHTTRALRRLR